MAVAATEVELDECRRIRAEEVTRNNREWGQAPARPIVVREKVKTLKLKKFKGLDDDMPMTVRLKTVRAEVRRQAATMGVSWQDNQLYHEVASHLEARPSAGSQR